MQMSELEIVIPINTRLHRLCTRFRIFEQFIKSERKIKHSKRVAEHCHWLARRYLLANGINPSYTTIRTNITRTNNYIHSVKTSKPSESK